MPSSVSITPVVREGEKKKDGTYPVRIRITYKRKQKVVSTNFLVDRSQLTRSFEIKDPAVAEAVAQVVRNMRAAANALDPFEMESMDVSDIAYHIGRALSGGDEAFKLDFPDYFQRIADEKKKNPRTNYLCALHSLCGFMGADHFDISSISSSMMRRYEKHLRAKYGDSARAVSLYTSAVAYVHRRAREEFNNEESDQIPIRNPFEYYHPPRQAAAKAGHRDIDMEIIREMLRRRDELTGRERLGVDLFLISFALMGMNTPDIYGCPRPKGGVIVYRRTKTTERRDDGAEMHVRIEPCVRPLIDEYGDISRAFNFHNRYSRYENLGRAANVGLKAFCERINVPKIDVYSARHSWGTVARNEAGIDPVTVDECMCHVNRSMRMADIYIRKDWSRYWKANAKVLALFDWPD